MKKRLIRWFFIILPFALIPFAIGIFLRLIAGEFTLGNIASSPEILFFTLMVCATALSDRNEIDQISKSQTVFQLLGSALIIGAVFSAILYGILLYNNIFEHDAVGFQSPSFFWFEIVFAIIFLVIGTVTEVIIGQIEDKP